MVSSVERPPVAAVVVGRAIAKPSWPISLSESGCNATMVWTLERVPLESSVANLNVERWLFDLVEKDVRAEVFWRCQLSTIIYLVFDRN